MLSKRRVLTANRFNRDSPVSTEGGKEDIDAWFEALGREAADFLLIISRDERKDSNIFFCCNGRDVEGETALKEDREAAVTRLGDIIGLKMTVSFSLLEDIVFIEVVPAAAIKVEAFFVAIDGDEEDVEDEEENQDDAPSTLSSVLSIKLRVLCALLISAKSFARNDKEIEDEDKD